jgi:hypothetical protein
MKSIQYSILSLCMASMLFISCNPIDLTGALSAWKTQNESYFTNMKDSTGYVLYTVPASNGGGSYYYKVTTPGDPNSTSPLSTDQVVVNYRGKLVNGFVFDQTYKGNVIAADTTATPRTFAVSGGIIQGWTDNLMQMKVGETRSIVMPQELGYGSQGSGAAISPYSTTIWVVQLVKVIHTTTY